MARSRQFGAVLDPMPGMFPSMLRNDAYIFAWLPAPSYIPCRAGVLPGLPFGITLRNVPA
jgi:hypothetical protein